MTDKKLEYIECDKGGFHFGEVLNMVCLDQSYIDDAACCCACVEEEHKNHITRPLRMVMKEARSQSQKIKPLKFNTDAIINIVQSSQKETLEEFFKYKKEIVQNLDSIENSLNSYFSFLVEQVKLKSSDPKAELEKAFEVICGPKNIADFRQAVKKIVSVIPKEGSEEESEEMSEQEFIQSINESSGEINKMIRKNIEEVNKKLTEYQASIQASINAQNLWKKASFKFSATVKHHDIKLVSELVVKSQNSAGYKFALMDTAIEKGPKVKTLAFKIKHCSSNWVAVGVCHKNVVVGKNYGFNFSSIGHGGYMVSANGGSWSHAKYEQNNTVKSFKFATNDIVTMTVDLNAKKLTFKKKSEKYEIDFSPIKDDPLYPCALFYYMNDEVEFLPNHKE